MADGMAGVIKQLQENNARQETLDQAILKQAVETKEIFLSSLGKLGESLRDTLQETSDDLTAAVLAPKKDDKDLASQQKETEARQSRLFEKIGAGISVMSGGFKKLAGSIYDAGKQKVKSGFGGLMSTIKNLAFPAAILAAMAFFNSEYWDKTKKFLNDEVIPALKTVYENFLVPIGNFLKDTFLRSWEDIKVLFDGIGESIDKFKEGDVLGGITTLISSLSTFFVNTIDNLITGVYNLFADFFGLEKTDSVFGEVKRFVVDTYNSIVEFFTGIFDFTGDIVQGAWTSTKDFVQGIFDGVTGFFSGAFSWSKDLVESTWNGLQNFATSSYNSVTGFFSDGFGWASDKVETAWNGLQSFATESFDKIVNFFTEAFSFVKESLQKFNVFKFIEGVVGDAIESVKAIFAGDFSLENFTKLFGSLFDIVTYPVNLAVNTIKDIFKFGDPDTEFRLSDFFFGEDGIISKAIDKITEMFTLTDTFLADFDLGDSAKRFLQGLLQAVLPPPDFLKLTIPEIDLGYFGKYGGGEFDLNPIPDAMYKAAGINPNTGRTFKEENAEAQEALEAAMNEMYGSPTATPGDAIEGGMGAGGGGTVLNQTNIDQSSVSQSSNQYGSTSITDAEGGGNRTDGL